MPDWLLLNWCLLFMVGLWDFLRPGTLIATDNRLSSHQQRIARLSGDSSGSHIRVRHSWPTVYHCAAWIVLAFLTSRISAQLPDVRVGIDSRTSELEANKIAFKNVATTLQETLRKRITVIESNGDTAPLDVDIAMQRVKFNLLRLQIEEAENLLHPGTRSKSELAAIKRETLVRWGWPINGVQIGLERVSLRDFYLPGEAVEFRRRIRNTTAGKLEQTLRFVSAESIISTLNAAGRFSVHGSGKLVSEAKFDLMPGRDEPIPGSHFRIETTNLQPGKYYVESYDRFILNDENVADEQAVASSPGWTRIPRGMELSFEIVEPKESLQPALEHSFELQGGPEIAWGSPTQGLQGGLRYTRDRVRPHEFSHADNWEWKIGDIVNAEFLVRNSTAIEKPLTFAVKEDDQSVELDPYVHTVQVYEMGGAIQNRRSASSIVRSLGYEPTTRKRTQILRRGESVVVARISFQLLQEPQDNAELRKLPRVNAVLVADNVRYSFHTRLAVEGNIGSSLSLTTGQTRLWLKNSSPAIIEPPTAATSGLGRIGIAYDIPGAMAQTTIIIRSIDDAKSVIVRQLTNRAPPEFAEVKAGQYEVFRRISLTIGSWTKDVECDRQTIIVTAGQVTEANFRRPQEHLTAAKGQWRTLASGDVEGAFLTVHAIAEKILDQGDPDGYFDFEFERETLSATTCGADGKFELEPLPPGRYAVVLRAFAEPTSQVGSIAVPYLVGMATFSVLGHSQNAHYFPNDFQVRRRWNLPQWIPNRVVAQ